MRLRGNRIPFEAVPILPEMKIPPGILDAISESDAAFGRVEAIVCPGVEDIGSTLAEIEDRVYGMSPLWGDRRLRVKNFATSRLPRRQAM